MPETVDQFAKLKDAAKDGFDAAKKGAADLADKADKSTGGFLKANSGLLMGGVLGALLMSTFMGGNLLAILGGLLLGGVALGGFMDKSGVIGKMFHKPTPTPGPAASPELKGPYKAPEPTIGDKLVEESLGTMTPPATGNAMQAPPLIRRP